ncbi:DUF2768 family protein [Bacillus aerolatus]|uniref:DUF2768 family protein n=1 Tax=Bacillus aerolatus TaxID=2653354 RepID=A0A6I1FJY3_9BACI|nr:DUF2768 domain-containing protein [Bacillus aerolatus]KAB7708900.1 DUF2768 family protein [Bacillus aerolatus]
MSTAMMNMWISFIGMGLMILSVFTIYISRYKFKNGFLKVISALLAYACMIIGGLIMVYIVFSGPA